MAEEMITITKKKYDSLTKAAIFLEYLSNAGVDNWEGYREACRAYYEDHPDEPA